MVPLGLEEVMSEGTPEPFMVNFPSSSCVFKAPREIPGKRRMEVLTSRGWVDRRDLSKRKKTRLLGAFRVVFQYYRN